MLCRSSLHEHLHPRPFSTCTSRADLCPLRLDTSISPFSSIAFRNPSWTPLWSKKIRKDKDLDYPIDARFATIHYHSTVSLALSVHISDLYRRLKRGAGESSVKRVGDGYTVSLSAGHVARSLDGKRRGWASDGGGGTGDAWLVCYVGCVMAIPRLEMTDQCERAS